MKTLNLLTLLAGSFAPMAEARELTNPVQLANALKTSFPTIHQWVNRCQTETLLTELRCYPGAGNLTECVGKGLNLDADPVEVKIANATQLVSALRKSGIAIQQNVSLKNLGCLNEYSGYDNCGSGRDVTSCTVD